MELFFTTVAIFAAFFLGMLVGGSTTLDMLEKDAMERGYAEYCTTTHTIEWKGECGK
jgi:hypothetical protein